MWGFTGKQYIFYFTILKPFFSFHDLLTTSFVVVRKSASMALFYFLFGPMNYTWVDTSQVL